METKEQRKERLLKLLKEIKEDTYNYVDMNDNGFIEEYDIRQIEREYENNIKELKDSDELSKFWFKQALGKLYSIRFRWC